MASRAKNGSAAFLAYKNHLTVINFAADWVKSIHRVPWPKPDFPDRCDWGPTISFAQYDKNGALNVKIHCTYPAEAKEAYLFARKDGTWTLKRHMFCQRFDKCRVAGPLADGFTSYYTHRRISRLLWNLERAPNPYLINFQHKLDPHASWTGPLHYRAKFDFGRSQSTLRFNVSMGADTWTFSQSSIILYVDKDKPIPVCPDTCVRASVTGRYLLFRPTFQSTSALIDLKTGQILLRGMKMPLWRY